MIKNCGDLFIMVKNGYIILTFNKYIYYYMCLACFHHLPRYTSFHLFFEIYALPDAMTRVINRPNQSLDEALCNLAQHLLLVRQVLSLTLLSSLRFLGSIEPLSHLPVNRLYIVCMYTWNKKKHHIIFIVIYQTKKENIFT